MRLSTLALSAILSLALTALTSASVMVMLGVLASLTAWPIAVGYPASFVLTMIISSFVSLSILQHELSEALR